MPCRRCKMPTVTANLLIVDDDATLRVCLSAVLSSLGYRVRGAADGFSALPLLRQEIPDIIVSDLNMPGLSGFEFLSVVRRRFPAIQVIAMSSAVTSDGVPAGVAADTFYQKGSGPGSLLQSIQAMASPDRPPLPRHARARPRPSGWNETQPAVFRSTVHYAHLPGVLKNFPQGFVGSPKLRQ